MTIDMKKFLLITLAIFATAFIAKQSFAEVTSEDIESAKTRYSIKLDMQHLMRITTHCMTMESVDNGAPKPRTFAEVYYIKCMKRFGDIIDVLPSEFRPRAIKHYYRVMLDVASPSK